MARKMWDAERFFLLVTLTIVLLMQSVQGDDPFGGAGGGGGQYRHEIRNALHTINNHIRIVHDKLERHEAREHQHGEVLRRLLEAQDKRQRAALDALNKLTQVVRALAEQAEIANKESRRSLDNLTRRVEVIHERQTSEEKEEYARCQEQLTASRNALSTSAKGVGAGEGDSEKATRALAEELGERLDGVARALDKAMRTDADAARSAATALAAAEQRVRAAADGTEALLLTYSKRLDAYRPPSTENDWHALFLGALEAQGQELKDMSHRTQENTKEIKRTAEEHQALSREALNETLRAVANAERRLAVDTEKAATRLERAATDGREQNERAREEVLRAINDLGEQVDTNADSARQAYEDIHGQVLALRSAEKVLIQTADNVLDTKRGVEYGVYQILQETGEVVKAQAKLLNATLHQRFDGISDTILSHQTGALTNLSTKIEAEISQVWRQIGIMYQQLTASASALDRLQEQTESYVNGSAAAMDSMEGKVGAIRERMNEVDDNLNYLLGRLSLFSSEFGQVRTGLAEALDDIRKTFEEAQAAVRRAKGPTFATPDGGDGDGDGDSAAARNIFPKDE